MGGKWFGRECVKSVGANIEGRESCSVTWAEKLHHSAGDASFLTSLVENVVAEKASNSWMGY